MALEFLLEKGFQFVSKNHRIEKAEIDIILRKDNTIHFVEVKTLSDFKHHDPHESVNRRKEKTMIQAGEEYLEREGLDLEIQFDVVGIVLAQPPQIQYFPAAFHGVDYL